jgi:DNA-binding MurR/RpiR family transcriptional regulator
MFSYKNIKNLNNTELLIYNYVLTNQEQVQYMTIRELADKSHVSTSTILRFCSKLGFDGYSEFKGALKHYINTVVATPPKEDLGELLSYFLNTNTNAFEYELSKGVDLIKSATNIIFVGIGTSGIMARYGSRYFANVGKLSWWFDDVHYPILNNMELDNTLVIFLSVSGETEQLIQQAMIFKEHDCKIISITNNPISRLAKISDWSISYNLLNLKFDKKYDITSQVPVVFIIEALARRL